MASFSCPDLHPCRGMELWLILIRRRRQPTLLANFPPRLPHPWLYHGWEAHCRHHRRSEVLTSYPPTRETATGGASIAGFSGISLKRLQGLAESVSNASRLIGTESRRKYLPPRLPHPWLYHGWE